MEFEVQHSSQSLHVFFGFFWEFSKQERVGFLQVFQKDFKACHPQKGFIPWKLPEPCGTSEKEEKTKKKTQKH